jgi:hypothetical protein
LRACFRNSPRPDREWARHWCCSVSSFL